MGKHVACSENAFNAKAQRCKGAKHFRRYGCAAPMNNWCELLPMKPETNIIQRSPLLYVKWIIVIEFSFAVGPFVLAALFDLQDRYEGAGLAEMVSYNVLIAVSIAVIQIGVILATFALWYFPHYELDGKHILYRVGASGEPRRLVAIDAIVSIAVKQGWLARIFDYGTLVIQRSGAGQQPVQLRGIAAPQAVMEMLEQMTAVQESDNDFAVLIDTAQIQKVIADGEGQHLEFKSSLMWDYRRQMVNKELYEPVMKNLVGFMNASGGIVLLGVADDGSILGIEQDWSGLKKQNEDGYEGAFNMAFNKMIGVEHRQLVAVSFHNADEKTICVLRAQPSPQPVFLTNNAGQEEFYIRAGNAAQPLGMSKAHRYIQSRFVQ
jgi:membrane protein YdbS with pleckstrin-like domain